MNYKTHDAIAQVLRGHTQDHISEDEAIAKIEKIILRAQLRGNVFDIIMKVKYDDGTVPDAVDSIMELMP